MAWSQVTTCVSIENEVGDSVAGTYLFDVYLSTGASSTGDLYLATSDVQVRFTTGNFSNPTITVLNNRSPPLGAIQNGYCTLVPTSSDNGGIVDWLSQAAYHSDILTSLSGDLLSINLNTVVATSTNFLTTIARINGTGSTHRLGRFSMTGYTGNGAGLRIDTTGILPTRVYTYATVSPYTVTATKIVACTALPLDLLALEAKQVDDYSVDLRWSTANETNTDYFDTERRSVAGTYQIIGTAGAQGTERASYLFTDRNPLQGRNIYRVRQIDTDGAFSVSNEVEIIFTEKDYVLVFPNPTADLITLQVHSSLNGSTEFRLFSLQGERLLQKRWLGNNSTSKAISLGTLAEDTYLYEVVVGGRRFYGKVVKTN
jgi:hypothetical protein